MIKGAHTIIYASDAEAARAFFRDVLGLPHVDAGDGWLIFKSPPGELAVHPTDPHAGGVIELFLMCDDLDATVADLEAKGVEFTTAITEQRWGRVTTFAVPGAGTVGLYQPKHDTAYDL
ncbi:VOC family protein [Nocardia terpenica]|uniref:VOC family protein n=1 Tax=Nocardia terpenica TaxID=455432 RepID=UPI001893F1F8|nr:VOC family protein [Nocardia terpenica]MBF6059166.1 VOC family protein [Nocardia terpenica]MBF6103295.1 VOC family protein [Nocardia terpenica]MBF6110516.1 VOC family protein [Nocardia terpenica]MBF6116647.1 VOC family protein [Nocardia terpenica]